MPFQAIHHYAVEPIQEHVLNPVTSGVDHGVGFIAQTVVHTFDPNVEVSDTPLHEGLHVLSREATDPKNPVNQKIAQGAKFIEDVGVEAAHNQLLLQGVRYVSPDAADAADNVVRKGVELLTPHNMEQAALFAVTPAASKAAGNLIGVGERAAATAAGRTTLSAGERAAGARFEGAAVESATANRGGALAAAEVERFEASVAQKAEGGAFAVVKKELPKVESQAVRTSMKKKLQQLGLTVAGMTALDLTVHNLAKSDLERKMDEHEEPQEYDPAGYDRTGPSTTPYQTEGHNAEEEHQADLAATAAPPPPTLAPPEPMHAHQSGLNSNALLLIGLLATGAFVVSRA